MYFNIVLQFFYTGVYKKKTGVFCQTLCAIGNVLLQYSHNEKRVSAVTSIVITMEKTNRWRKTRKRKQKTTGKKIVTRRV